MSRYNLSSKEATRCSRMKLPAVHERCFNSPCFRKIHNYLKSDDLEFDPDKTDWESRLSVAIAFAFQKQLRLLP